jgi:hypothetical protein
MGRMTDEGWDDTEYDDDDRYDTMSIAEQEEHERHLEREWFTVSLAEDVERSQKLIERTPGRTDSFGQDFARRTFVRTVFSEVEGFCALAMDQARSLCTGKGSFKSDYTPEERAVLRGQVPRLDDSGRPEFDDLKMKTLPAIRFALSLAGRGDQSLPQIDYKRAEGWPAVRVAIQIRDRLTHPKEPKDLDVTDEDLEHVRAAREWFHGEYVSRQQASRKAHSKRLKDILDHVKEARAKEATRRAKR